MPGAEISLPFPVELQILALGEAAGDTQSEPVPKDSAHPAEKQRSALPASRLFKYCHRKHRGLGALLREIGGGCWRPPKPTLEVSAQLYLGSHGTCRSQQWTLSGSLLDHHGYAGHHWTLLDHHGHTRHCWTLLDHHGHAGHCWTLLDQPVRWDGGGKGKSNEIQIFPHSTVNGI